MNRIQRTLEELVTLQDKAIEALTQANAALALALKALQEARDELGTAKPLPFTFPLGGSAGGFPPMIPYTAPYTVPNSVPGWTPANPQIWSTTDKPGLGMAVGGNFGNSGGTAHQFQNKFATLTALTASAQAQAAWALGAMNGHKENI